MSVRLAEDSAASASHPIVRALESEAHSTAPSLARVKEIGTWVLMTKHLLH